MPWKGGCDCQTDPHAASDFFWLRRAGNLRAVARGFGPQILLKATESLNGKTQFSQTSLVGLLALVSGTWRLRDIGPHRLRISCVLHTGLRGNAFLSFIRMLLGLPKVSRAYLASKLFIVEGLQGKIPVAKMWATSHPTMDKTVYASKRQRPCCTF